MRRIAIGPGPGLLASAPLQTAEAGDESASVTPPRPRGVN